MNQEFEKCGTVFIGPWIAYMFEEKSVARLLQTELNEDVQSDGTEESE